MKAYFTSKLIEHNKNKEKNQDIKNTFTILVASSSIFLMNSPIACCLPHLRNFVYDDSSFFKHLRHTSQHYSLVFKSVAKVFL